VGGTGEGGVFDPVKAHCGMKSATSMSFRAENIQLTVKKATFKKILTIWRSISEKVYLCRVVILLITKTRKT
jgi:hypothetical protein